MKKLLLAVLLLTGLASFGQGTTTTERAQEIAARIHALVDSLVSVGWQTGSTNGLTSITTRDSVIVFHLAGGDSLVVGVSIPLKQGQNMTITGNASTGYIFNATGSVKRLAAAPTSVDSVYFDVSLHKLGILNPAGTYWLYFTPSDSSLVGLIPASPPTTGVVDDAADTYNWTNNSLYTAASDYEYTLNGGSTVSTASAKPIVVGDINKAIGQVGVRVKTGSDHSYSSWLFNTTAFTATSSSDTPIPWSFTQLTESPTNTYSGDGQNRSSGAVIAANTSGKIKAQYVGVTNSCIINWFLNTTSSLSETGYGFVIYLQVFYLRYNGADVSSYTPTANEYYRLYRDGATGTVTFETSPDNSTWTVKYTYDTTTTAALYFKVAQSGAVSTNLTK